jgi:hypothetical protein
MVKRKDKNTNNDLQKTTHKMISSSCSTSDPIVLIFADEYNDILRSEFPYFDCISLV